MRANPRLNDSDWRGLQEGGSMATSYNEAFSRILIDKALEASRWNLLDQQQVQFELNTAHGRVDYLLRDSLGRVLCVLEAKREDLDPYDAKEQARGYAENLNEGSGHFRVILYAKA
jgi:predicted type IV restriction endonuclease